MTGVFTAKEQKTQAALKQDAEAKAARKALRKQRWKRRWILMGWGVKSAFALIALGAFLFIFKDRMFVSVQSGEVMVVYYTLFGGTKHNEIQREGLHIIAPWDQAFKYQVSRQNLIIPMTVMAKNSLEVKVDAQIRFNLVDELVPYLHRRYGPDYVKTIITPQLTEVIQSIIGKYIPEELFVADSGASVTSILQEAERTIGGYYVHVDKVALLNIRLPEKVQLAIQAKAEAEQNALAGKFLVQLERQQAERRSLEANSLAQYSKAVSEIPKSVLVWKGIEATLELAKSPNAKVIVMGNGKDSLPLVLGNVPDLAVPAAKPAAAQDKPAAPAPADKGGAQK